MPTTRRQGAQGAPKGNRGVRGRPQVVQRGRFCERGGNGAVRNAELRKTGALDAVDSEDRELSSKKEAVGENYRSPTAQSRDMTSDSYFQGGARLLDCGRSAQTPIKGKAS